MDIKSEISGLTQGFRLGEWLVYPLSGVIIRNGHSQHVEPKVMNVLLCLAMSPGKVVTRDELINCVWSDVVVTDDALTRCISELRTLLGDTARVRRYIRTIPKRGYSLLLPVEKPITAVQPSMDTKTGKDGSYTDRSVVVLPFVNMSPEKDNDYFSDGLTEELINALTQITRLRVAARTSTFAFKGRNVDIGEIGEKLDVRHVLEGSVRMEGEQIRITAQLVNVDDGFQLWAGSYNRKLTSIFDIQVDIARAVANQLKLKFGGDNTQRLATVGTSNLEAYKWYLRGRQKYQTEQPGFFYTGVDELKKATELDPGFADAYGLLAYLNIMRSAAEPYSAVSTVIRESYQKALTLNPLQPEALMAKAVDTRWRSWNWREVYWLFEQALNAAPNNPHVLTQYASRYYRDLGSLEKAENLLWRAIDIDPLNAGPRSAICYVLRYAGKHKEAIEEAELAIRLNPQYSFAHYGLILALISDQQYAKAMEKIEHAEGFLGVDSPLMLSSRGRLYGHTGKLDEANRMKNRLIELSQGSNGRQCLTCIGWVCIAMGEIEEGISWLDKTLEAQISQVVVARATAQSMTESFSEPAFQAFLAKMNLDDESIAGLKEEGLW